MLFSGGVDSSVIAALLASSGAVREGEAVDLLNVSFGKGGASPDRSVIKPFCSHYQELNSMLE